MKSIKGRIIPIISLLSLAATAGAQEFFREFGSSRSSGGIGRLSPAAEVFTGNDPNGLSPITPFDEVGQEEDYNMRWGIFDFIIAAGLGVEFNDNITLAHRDELSDIIFRPEIDIEGVVRFSDTNRIRIGVGVSYAKYLDHSEFDTDGALIAPTSAIVWTAKSGAFTFTLRERLSYQEDPFALPVASVATSNTALYKRWENQAGIQVDWEANQYTKITAGYDRYDLWAKDETFKSQSKAIDTIYLRPSYQISPYVTVGLNTSVSFVKHREDIQADGQSLLVGPYVQWKVSDRTDVYVEVGYQQTTFDGKTQIELLDPTTGLGTGTFVEDGEDTSGVYAKIEITNRPTENFRHKLTASKTTEFGFGTNSYDLYHAEYSAEWNFAENTSLSPTLFYEYFETSGNVSETGHRFGAALGLHHIFPQHLTLGLDYRFLMKDSDQPDADYRQNLGMLSLYYKF